MISECQLDITLFYFILNIKGRLKDNNNWRGFKNKRFNFPVRQW